jgi:predicted ester cyclase
MTLTDEQRIKLQRETIIQHMTGENEHDWDKVYDTFIRDERAYYDVMPFNTRYGGFQGVQDFYSAFEAAVPDFKLTVTGEYDVPGCSIREVTVRGTHQGDFAGVEAAGRPVSFELAAFYLFGDGDEAGKLLAERVYFDTETLLRQMRGEEGPTGIGLADEVGRS